MFTNGLQFSMIKTFSHKGLAELFEAGTSSKIDKRFKAKSIRCLDILASADSLTELRVPGFNFHSLQGKPKRYAMKVSANYRITFAWQKGAIDVDFEDYH